MPWREWVASIEKRWSSGYIDSNEVTALIEGLKICAEAAEADHRIHELFETGVHDQLVDALAEYKRTHDAAFEWLRGVGRD